jgi:hypothetical protein
MEKVIAGLENHGGSASGIPLIIEGKSFVWPHQYITGAQIKQLAGLPPAEDLFLSIANPWSDEPVGDEKEIDLALPGTEQFFLHRKLPYSINGVSFSSNKQYIKGSFIRRQGNITAAEDIFLKVEAGWEDELVEDNEWIDLARPGKEHFVSKKISFCIIVNLKEKDWLERKISYAQVVKLAYPEYNGTAVNSYTVKFSDGPKQNPKGSMSLGDSVYVKNKMVFDVTATNKS